jgi:hypothetical protein
MKLAHSVADPLCNAQPVNFLGTAITYTTDINE